MAGNTLSAADKRIIGIVFMLAAKDIKDHLSEREIDRFYQLWTELINGDN